MNELAVFTGVGGGLLAPQLQQKNIESCGVATRNMLGWRTVCYVENNPYAVEVLKARIRDGWLDDAPIWDDANTFDGRPWAGRVDIVSAGFPCQPFSSAGKRLGENDPRNGWPATIRIVREIRPRVVWLENVPGLTRREKFIVKSIEKIRQFTLFRSSTYYATGRGYSHRLHAVFGRSYFGRVLGDLAESGYCVAWDCISAGAVGAPHKRERIWLLAYAEGQPLDLAKLARNAQILADGDGDA